MIHFNAAGIIPCPGCNSYKDIFRMENFQHGCVLETIPCPEYNSLRLPLCYRQFSHHLRFQSHRSSRKKSCGDLQFGREHFIWFSICFLPGGRRNVRTVSTQVSTRQSNFRTSALMGMARCITFTAALVNKRL